MNENLVGVEESTGTQGEQVFCKCFFFGKFCRKIPVPESLFNEVSGPETYSFIEN